MLYYILRYNKRYNKRNDTRRLRIKTKTTDVPDRDTTLTDGLYSYHQVTHLSRLSYTYRAFLWTFCAHARGAREYIRNVTYGYTSGRGWCAYIFRRDRWTKRTCRLLVYGARVRRAVITVPAADRIKHYAGGTCEADRARRVYRTRTRNPPLKPRLGRRRFLTPSFPVSREKNRRRFDRTVAFSLCVSRLKGVCPLIAVLFIYSRELRYALYVFELALFAATIKRAPTSNTLRKKRLFVNINCIDCSSKRNRCEHGTNVE